MPGFVECRQRGRWVLCGVEVGLGAVGGGDWGISMMLDCWCLMLPSIGLLVSGGNGGG